MQRAARGSKTRPDLAFDFRMMISASKKNKPIIFHENNKQTYP